MKNELKRLDELIAFFENLAMEYPLASYKDTLAQLKQDRVNLVSKIGKTFTN